MDDSSKVYIEQGDSCMREGGYEKAMEYFNRAISLNPRYIPAYFERAQWYQLEGHAYQEAIKDYTTILTICPSDYHDEYKRNQNSVFRDAYSLRGMLKKLYFQDYIGAIEDYSKAIELGEDDYADRASCKSYLEDYRGAIQDYSKAIELKPHAYNPDKSMWYNNRGLAKFRIGDKDGACLDWSKAGEFGGSYAFDNIKRYCN